MLWHLCFSILLLLLAPTAIHARPSELHPARSAEDNPSPAFTSVPELQDGFHLLYIQQFGEARKTFNAWESRNPQEPFGQVAIAASYLFEELYRQGVWTSDFFL